VKHDIDERYESPRLVLLGDAGDLVQAQGGPDVPDLIADWYC
jgi:hypothetical protein